MNSFLSSFRDSFTSLSFGFFFGNFLAKFLAMACFKSPCDRKGDVPAAPSPDIKLPNMFIDAFCVVLGLIGSSPIRSALIVFGSPVYGLAIFSGKKA